MSDDILLPSIEIESANAPDAAVIWLHGLGADGNDFVPIVPELKLPAALRVRFIFPHAPVRRVTINQGYAMRAWYDIAAADLNSRADLSGVKISQHQVEALIARERQRGIVSRRIILAGFSQGGAIALYAGLRHAEPLAGILALSTYLVAGDVLQAEASDANRATPIFMGHGTFDPTVQHAWAVASRRALEAFGVAVEWHEYRMGHTLAPEEIVHVSAWIQRVLAPAQPRR